MGPFNLMFSPMPPQKEGSGFSSPPGKDNRPKSLTSVEDRVVCEVVQ